LIFVVVVVVVVVIVVGGGGVVDVWLVPPLDCCVFAVSCLVICLVYVLF
jgi:hypothetical protein